MVEDGQTRAAAPECRDALGWVYFDGHCYMFNSYHVNFAEAGKLCDEAGAFLTDLTSQTENDFIKATLKIINPKDGTNYWIGGKLLPNRLCWSFISALHVLVLRV